MMITRFFFVMFIFLFFQQTSYPVTLVYNLKNRRSFTIVPSPKPKNLHWLMSVVPIVYLRSRHIVDARKNLDVREKRRAAGSLCNIRYATCKHWWVEATTGFEVDHGRYTGSDSFHASRAGFDDIVLTGGHRYFMGDHAQIVAYGLAGFPARRTLDASDRREPLVGTRLYNIGFGLEGSCCFLNHEHRFCAGIVQARIIHGFNRSWLPVLSQDARLQPGNITDFLFSMQFREKRTIVETGYNLTLFSHQALILATEKIKSNTFIRHSGYVTLSHTVLHGLFGNQCIIGASLNMSRSKKFDSRTLTGLIFGTLIF